MTTCRIMFVCFLIGTSTSINVPNQINPEPFERSLPVANCCGPNHNSTTTPHNAPFIFIEQTRCSAGFMTCNRVCVYVFCLELFPVFVLKLS